MICEVRHTGHFLVFVSYEGKFQDITVVPEVWVVPHNAVGRFVKHYSGRRNVSRARLVKYAATITTHGL